MHSCKPTEYCVRSKNIPFWKDGIDFEHRQEHVIYKLAEHQAKFEWKADRQHDKSLNIHLPVGITYYQWKENQENLKRKDSKINYEQFMAKMENLTNDEDIDDITMAQKIRKEEKRMKEEMKVVLKRFWNLQTEKKTVADGKLFDLDMINERCLPIINSLLDRLRAAPKFKIQTISTPPQLAIANYQKGVQKEIQKVVNNDEKEVWKGEWSDYTNYLLL